MIYTIKTDKGIAYESRVSILSTYGTIRAYSILTSTFTIESNLDLTRLIDIEWIFSVNSHTRNNINQIYNTDRNKLETLN